MSEFGACYKGKTVLVTGHTGFKGSWLTIWLRLLGANVVGYALEPITSKDNFVLTDLTHKMEDIRGDIRDRKQLQKVFDQYAPDFVFHLAAQPLVKWSYKEPVYTYETNVMGTINVLECMRSSQKKQVGIFITTDKCYENKEQIWGYREEDALGGYDPYSSSKGAAEIAINSWRSAFMNPKDYTSHHKSIASVRAGNVIGGGDWAKNRIIPDCIRSIEKGEPIEIRSPHAIRPWQHVLEPLSGYLMLGEKMWANPTAFCEGWNFGPYSHQILTVQQVAQALIDAYGKGSLQVVEATEHEAELLTLDITKAFWYLKWHPPLNWREMIQYTVDWYKAYTNCNVYMFCEEQIQDFMRKQKVND